MKFGDDWGPTCWIFFHSLAEKVNEDAFIEMSPIIIKMIKDICAILPCPDCRMHSTGLLNGYKYYHLIKKKEDLKKFIFELHNYVNTKTNKPIAPIKILETYKDISFRKVTANWFNHFRVNIHDVKLIWEKKQRNKVRNQTLSILNDNIDKFTI